VRSFLGGVGAAALTAVAVVATATPASAAIVVKDLGTMPRHTSNQATSVGEDGVAVGYSTSPNGYSRAVVYRVYGVTGIGTHERPSQAHDLSGESLFVGWAESVEGQRMPTWWDDFGSAYELLGGSGEARGTNDAGVIVGLLSYPGQSAARWENTTAAPVRLPTLPGGANDSIAYDVNNEGVAVGYSRGADGVRHAVRWNAAGTVRQLGTPAGFPECFAHRLSDTGYVVGACSAGDDRIPVRWDHTGAATVLATLGTPNAEASGVNDAGTVVGSAEDAEGRTHAIRWNTDGTVTRLAPLAGSHGVAMDINNSGTIVGYSHLSGSSFRATSWQNG
jgi:probable HAF family extracellular repeat protein